MHFVSTRENISVDFKDAVLQGLAADGGLFVPQNITPFSAVELAYMASLNYRDLAYEIISKFTGDLFAESELKSIINNAYSEFRHHAIAPVIQLEKNLFTLELFHGPTLAFKDFALQLLGHIAQKLLSDSKQKTLVLGATSGDTGSAAIAGFKGKENIDIVILYPHNRTSVVQRKQMTSIADKNVHAVAIEGNFDDCQNLVKRAFADKDLRKKTNLLAVNSINFARIMAQIVYYFYAAFSLGAPDKKFNFSVPTGNFGDIYAGFLAKKMGLGIGKLIIASNRNDILTRGFLSGNYTMQEVVPSHSPSMDIQISSNFERLLFDLYEQDGEAIKSLMNDFKDKGSFTLSPQVHNKLKADFAAYKVDDAATIAAMQKIYTDTGYLADPHSAIGIKAAQDFMAENPGNSHATIALATAHPAKFDDALAKANLPKAQLPGHLSDLMSREEKQYLLNNDYNALLNFIEAL